MSKRGTGAFPRLEVTPRGLVEGVPGPVHLQTVFGSHAYGTDVASSDVDIRGVYALPNHAFLGLSRPVTTWEKDKADTVFWELGHFVQLLVKGNPNIVGMLHVPLDCVSVLSGLGDSLRRIRPWFVTQEFRSSYMGWIKRESLDIERLHKGNAKRLSHVPRLAWELMSVYETGTLHVRASPTRAATIRAIKTGEMDYDDALAYVGEVLIELSEMDADRGPSLPPVDRITVEKWLLDQRHRYGGLI